MVDISIPPNPAWARRDASERADTVEGNSKRKLLSQRNPEGVISVVWEYWRITQSQFRHREIGVVDLGEIE
jgi:hypothetical protein